MAILRWIAGATAVAGSYHAVSGASISVLQPPNSEVTRTNGVASSFRISITYSDGRTVLTPQLYTAQNLPPVFDPPSRSGSIWRITCNPTQPGVYDNVRITAWRGTTTSNPEFSATVVMRITVVDGAPVITSQPVSTTAEVGSPAQFSVAASGGNLTYRWRKGDLELQGQTSATLRIESVTPDDQGEYRVFVQNSGGGVLSDPATLTVTGGTAKPTFTVQPEGATVHEGESVVLRSEATGAGTLSYQWFRGEAPVDGALEPTLTLPAVTVGQAGSYTVAVTGSGGTTTSTAAQVQVAPRLTIGGVVPDGNGVRVSFGGIPGRTYLLEGSPTLDSPQWTEKSQRVATGDDALVAPIEAVPAQVLRIRAR